MESVSKRNFQNTELDFQVTNFRVSNGTSLLETQGSPWKSRVRHLKSKVFNSLKRFSV